MEPRVVDLYGPNLLSSEVTVNSTLPLGCDCCSIWEQHGQCKLYLDIVSDTQIIGTSLQASHHCKFELSRSITQDTIPIVARKRIGTSSGTFVVPFNPISLSLYDPDGLSIWQGYTPPTLQVQYIIRLYCKWGVVTSE